MIKLFVSDMDGTLLHNPNDAHSRDISDENIEAVKKLHESGVRFMMASGRDVYFRYSLEKILGFQVDAIGMNGCNVVIDNVEICNHGLTRQDSYDLLEMIKTCEIDSNFMGITNVGDYVFYDIKKAPFDKFKEFENEGVMRKVPEISMVDWIVDINRPPYNKVVGLVWSTEDRDKMILKFKERFDDRFDIIYSGPENIEIMPKHISKGQALLELIKIKGFEPTEVAVIGDSMNDVSMLEAIPFSFSMSHADEIIKASANNIVESVAEAIEFVMDYNQKELKDENELSHAH